jgi:hypothetical protein
MLLSRWSLKTSNGLSTRWKEKLVSWVTYERKPGDYIDVEESSVNTPTKPILVSYRVVILVKITPEGTMVRVRRYVQEWLDKWTPVQSDLQFERQFLLMVDRRLGVNP